MQKKNLIPVILLSISCILFLTAVILLLNSDSFSFRNNTGKNNTNSNGIKEEVSNSNNNKEENDNSNTEIEDVKDTNTSNKDETVTTPSVDNSNNVSTSNNESNKNTNSNSSTNVNTTPSPKPTENINQSTSKPSTSTNTEVEPVKNENSLISYFQNQEISTFSNVDQDNRTMREKAKDAFVGIVDFIFYDKEVKGYTFKGLTTSAKLKVIKIALSIDSKIDEYFPDYKDVMKDKYSNIKGKLAVKYLEFTSSLCESVGEETCNQAKEDFNKMKESFGFTWQLIKELASSGSTKVKEFYESWRESE